MIVWIFVVSLSCYCPLGSHSETLEVGPFPDFAACERLRQAMAPGAAPCHQRDMS